MTIFTVGPETYCPLPVEPERRASEAEELRTALREDRDRLGADFFGWQNVGGKVA